MLQKLVGGDVCVCVCVVLGNTTFHVAETDDVDSLSKTLRSNVQQLSLGRYLFKKYTFVPKGSIVVP